MALKNLKVGDEQAAILAIQSSQADPLKALAELVENAIDAGARTVVITRRRRKGGVEISVTDDGEGVVADRNGLPDMDRVATSICDSFKKSLDERLRQNVQGEFGIGLLGFAAIGDRLEMVSQRTAPGKARYLRLRAGSVEYEEGVSRTRFERSGTEVTVRPVRRDIRHRLTADKIARYLGQELRERIIGSKTRIHIDDRVGRRKQVEVRPYEYTGERIVGISKVKTGLGTVRFRLYVGRSDSEGRVSIYRRGTKVVDDAAAVDELNHDPFNNSMLEGMVDCPFINVPPTTRKGIVLDERFEVFVEALKSVEFQVAAALGDAKRRQDEKLSKEVVKALRDAFREVMRDLPADYAWFGARPGAEIPDHKRGKEERDGEAETEEEEDRPGRKKRWTVLAAGPLDHVTVTPRLTRVAPNEKKKFLARAWTEKNELIPVGVSFRWELLQSMLGTLKPADSECHFTASAHEGEGEIGVQATLGERTAEGTARVLIVQVAPKKPTSEFPIPKAVYRPGEPWRSRYIEAINTLEYNSGHEDYVEARKRSRRAYLRYLAFLYAKHLVLHNYQGSPDDALLERMIEVIARVERRF